MEVVYLVFPAVSLNYFVFACSGAKTKLRFVHILESCPPPGVVFLMPDFHGHVYTEIRRMCY